MPRRSRFRRDGDTLIASLKARATARGAFSGVLALGDGRGLSFTAVPGLVPDGGRAIGDLGARAVLIAVLGALVGGMLLNLMPCVFPILALKALHLARSGGGEREARRDALAYAAGAVVGTGLLGAALLAFRAGGSAAGWAFQLQDPRTIVVLLLLATAIALNLLRMFELPVLGGEARPTGQLRDRRAGRLRRDAVRGAVPWRGAGHRPAAARGGRGVGVCCARAWAGLPFVILAFVPALRERLPRPGPWMARLQRFLAIPMAATAAACLWLLWRQGGGRRCAIGLGAVVALALVLLWAGRRRAAGKGGGLVALLGALLIVAAAALTVLVASRWARRAFRWRGAMERSGGARRRAPRGDPCSSISPPTGA